MQTLLEVENSIITEILKFIIEDLAGEIWNHWRTSNGFEDCNEVIQIPWEC